MTAETPRLGSAERELLLSCARVGPQKAAAIGHLHDSGLDWDALLFHARLHSVAPLLHHHLSALSAGCVPRRAARALLALRHRAAYQNTLFAEHHRAIVDALWAAQVPVGVQKGLAVIEPLYGQLDLRPLIDLIYLVPRGHRDDAAAVLASLGYVPQPPHPVDSLYRWSCPQTVLARAGRLEVAVILQEDLVSWPRAHGLRPEAVWARTREGEIAGRRVRLLDPTDQLLYLCLQADNHGHFNRIALDEMDAAELLFAEWSNNRLIRFTDVHGAARRLDWDADALAERAAASGLGDAVRTTLTLTNRLLGTVVPPELLDRVDAPGTPHMRRLVFRALAASERSKRSGLAASVGRVWRSRRPRTQIRLARLLGLAEYAAPSVGRLRLRYGAAPRTALAPLAALNPLTVLARSTLAFALTLRHRQRSRIPSASASE
jgi:Uncharacterised nucleotidyltransferase